MYFRTYLEMSFYRGNQVEVRSLGWTLIQQDWCSYKKGTIWAQRRRYEETQGEVVHEMPEANRTSERLGTGPS